MGRVEEPAALVVGRRGPAAKQLDRHAERGDRRAQLVGERRHELLAPGLLVAHVGDVLQDQDESGVRAVTAAERRRAEHIVVIAAAEEERQLHGVVLVLGVGEELAHRLAQSEVMRVVRAQVVEADADRLRASEAEDGAGDLVHVHHDAVGIEHDQPVLDALDDGLDQVDARALDRHRCLSGERLEELTLVERQRRPGGLDAEREHADRAADGAERYVEPLASGERVGPASGRPVVLPHPGRRRALGFREGGLGRTDGAQDEPSRVGQEEGRPGAEETRHVVEDHAHQIVEVGRARDLACEGIERRRALLPSAGGFGLVADASGQLAGQHRDHEEHDHGQDVLRLGDGEREARLDEDEVVHEQSEDRRQDRRPEPREHGGQQHRRQEDHAGVCEGQQGHQSRGDEAGRAHEPAREGIAAESRLRARALGYGGGPRRALVLAGDRPRRGRPALPDDPVDRRSAQALEKRAMPRRGLGLRHDAHSLTGGRAHPAPPATRGRRSLHASCTIALRCARGALPQTPFGATFAAISRRHADCRMPLQA